MKEIIIYVIAALASLGILGYSVHMLIGGVVSAQTEQAAILGACAVGVGVIAYMVWDVVKRRKPR